jgi:hypothetical protein
MCGIATTVGHGLIKDAQFQLVEIEGIAGYGGVVWLALLFDQIFRVSPQTSTAICPATSNLCFSTVPLHKLDHDRRARCWGHTARWERGLVLWLEKFRMFPEPVTPE